jgi:hypothetical protein
MYIVRDRGVDEMHERMEGRRGNTRTIEGDDAEERVVVVALARDLSDGVALWAGSSTGYKKRNEG